MGVSFAGGTTDGPGAAAFHQENFNIDLLLKTTYYYFKNLILVTVVYSLFRMIKFRLVLLIYSFQ